VQQQVAKIMNAGTYLRHAAKYDHLAIKENYDGRDDRNIKNKKIAIRVNPTNRFVV